MEENKMCLVQGEINMQHTTTNDTWFYLVDEVLGVQEIECLQEVLKY